MKGELPRRQNPRQHQPANNNDDNNNNNNNNNSTNDHRGNDAVPRPATHTAPGDRTRGPGRTRGPRVSLGGPKRGSGDFMGAGGWNPMTLQATFRQIRLARPCGLMDKALVFGTKDCRFESCQGHCVPGHGNLIFENP